MGNYSFSQVPRADIPRSRFNRSFNHKTTFDAGLLIPVFVDEALPGDTFNVKASVFARLATPIFPIMDNMIMDFFFFAVPNRLLWDNWERFCGAQTDPDDSTDFTVPTLAEAEHPAGELGDYFGIPTGITFPAGTINCLPFRAYNLIWNEWFRDQNLQDSLTVNTGDGDDSIAEYAVKRRGKRHDYFTSCLPWPQKGAGVTLPLGTTAPVIPEAANTAPILHDGVESGALVHTSPSNVVNFAGLGANPTHNLVWDDPGLVADLSNATAATINSLREAFQIQKLLERDARGGTRYVEVLKSHFGVTSPDFRLQRPEFLGGGSVPVNINPVAQTSRSDAGESPQGNLAAYGVAGGSGIGFTKAFVEHCYIIGLVCVRAELTYQQGLHRMWSRSTRYDFYWPAFAHLGEQAVYQKEIFADGIPGVANDDKVFGYQERWAEYRYKPSQITGLFRSSHPQSLDAWHLAQEFAAAPSLDDSFIQENPPVDRVIAVTAEPHFLFDSYFKMETTRPMPTYSVPGLIDHF